MSRRVVLGAVLAAIAILGLWYLLLWNPTKNDLDAARRRADEAESQQAELQAAIARLRTAQRDEPLQRARLETLRTAIPDTPNLAQFILDTNDAASRSGIDFISIAPTEPRAAAARPGAAPAAGATTTTTAPGATAAAAPGPAEIGLQMQIRGGYFQVLDFLNRLDRLPRLVVTDAVNVSADAAGNLTVGLTARMFVRNVPAGFAGATPTTAPAAGGATTTTAPGGATTTTAAGGATTTTAAGGRP